MPSPEESSPTGDTNTAVRAEHTVITQTRAIRARVSMLRCILSISAVVVDEATMLKCIPTVTIRRRFGCVEPSHYRASLVLIHLY